MQKILFSIALLSPVSNVYAVPPAPPLCDITAEVISIERDTRQVFIANLLILTSENANTLANNCPALEDEVLENTSLFWWELSNENPPEPPFLIRASLHDIINPNSNHSYRLANIRVIETDEVSETINESLNQADELEFYLIDDNEIGTDSLKNNLFQMTLVFFVIFGIILILRKLLPKHS